MLGGGPLMGQKDPGTAGLPSDLPGPVRFAKPNAVKFAATKEQTKAANKQYAEEVRKAAQLSPGFGLRRSDAALILKACPHLKVNQETGGVYCEQEKNNKIESCPPGVDNRCVSKTQCHYLPKKIPTRIMEEPTAPVTQP
jgi:hypothetical protein